MNWRIVTATNGIVAGSALRDTINESESFCDCQRVNNSRRAMTSLMMPMLSLMMIMMNCDSSIKWPWQIIIRCTRSVFIFASLLPRHFSRSGAETFELAGQFDSGYVNFTQLYNPTLLHFGLGDSAHRT